MNNKKWPYILLVLLGLLLLGILGWATMYRLSWIKFTMSLPLPGWLKMLLWGWF